MRRSAAFVVCLILLACQDDPIVAPSAPRPSASILDARHNGGNAHFYFLPPLVPDPGATGVFDGSLSPNVRICEWTGSTCRTELADYTMTSGPGSETVRISEDEGYYIVNWHTDQFALDPTRTYRISVLVAGAILGYADVDVVGSGRELRNVQTGEYVGLVNGRTLPIKFRVEVGAVSVVGASGGTITAAEGAVTLVFTPAAVEGPTGITVAPAMAPLGDPRPVPGSFFSFGPDGIVFDAPVELTIRYDPTLLPAGVPEGSLRLHKVVRGGLVEVAGSSVDVARRSVTGIVHGFSDYGAAQGGDVTWGLSTSSLDGNAGGIWGTGPTNVYATATRSVWKYNGSVWAVMDSFPGRYVEDVWGTSTSDIWVVGGGENTLTGAFFGTIWHYDGQSWSVQWEGGTYLMSVWGSSATDVFAVGEYGIVLHYDGVTWAPVNAGATGYDLLSVNGTGPGDVYAVGAGTGGVVLHYDGVSWQPQVTPAGTRALRDVWAASPTDVYAVGHLTLLHYDGTSWTRVAVPFSGELQPPLDPLAGAEFLYGVWGSSGVDVYVVGGGDTDRCGAILHYDGTQWSYQAYGYPLCAEPRLYKVWGSSPNDVFAGGAFVILRGTR